VKDVTGQNFGYLVAYVLPGFLLLLTAEQVWPGWFPWLDSTSGWAAAPTVGGFLFVTLASVAAGVTASTARWLIVDWLHHRTGIRPPHWDDSKLQDKLSAFEALVDAHYRYYQFYANSLVSLTVMLAMRVASGPVGSTDVVLALLCGLFWVGSRDTLRRYYRRTEILLGSHVKGINHDERTSSEEGRHRIRLGTSNGPERQQPLRARRAGVRRKQPGQQGRAAGRGHEL
jgi:hypothetical protein